MNNLQIAFPEKKEKEKLQIAKKFYHNLIDMFIETIKMLSVSDKFIAKRFTANWDTVNALKASGKSVQVHLGHNFNWEWGNSVFVKNTLFKFLAVYMPIENKILNRIFYQLRTHNGAIFLSAAELKKDFTPYKNTQYLLGLIADQSPSQPEYSSWYNFFGRPTPFLKGPAKAAIANNTAVVFAFIHKPRRGYYEGVFTVAVEDPATSTEQEITQKFVSYLEDVIRQYPDMWLWSHRRWKWEWKPEYGDVIKTQDHLESQV